MSLILDALRRSEQGDSPAVQVPTDISREQRPVDRRWILLPLLGCVLAGGIAGWLVRDAGADKTPISSPRATSSVSEAQRASPSVQTAADGADKAVISTAAVAEQASAGISESAANAPVTISSRPRADDVQIAALHRQMWADAASNPSPDRAAGVSDRNRRDRNETLEVEAAGENGSSIAPPIDLAAAMASAARELGEISLIPHSAVLLENLSQQQKDQVPTIVYTAHDFQENGSSTVELNRRRLGVGQRAGPITVSEILPDSVVLRVNGMTFRLRALNTWANL